jgi:hypothetical protein
MVVPGLLERLVKSVVSRWIAASVFVFLGLIEILVIYKDKADSERRYQNGVYPLTSVGAAYIVGVDLSDARLAKYRQRILDATRSSRWMDGADRYGDRLQGGRLDILPYSDLMPKPTDGMANDIFRKAYLEIAYFTPGADQERYRSQNFLNPLDPNPDLFGASRGSMHIECYLYTVKKNCAIYLGPWSDERKAWQTLYGKAKAAGLADILGGVVEFRIHAGSSRIVRAPLYLDKLDMVIGDRTLYFVRDADTASRGVFPCVQGKTNIQLIDDGKHEKPGVDLARVYRALIPLQSIEDVFGKFDHNCYQPSLDIPEARNEP